MNREEFFAILRDEGMVDDEFIGELWEKKPVAEEHIHEERLRLTAKIFRLDCPHHFHRTTEEIVREALMPRALQ